MTYNFNENDNILNSPLLSTENSILKLTDFQGRIVILDFFATWCRPCKKNIQKLNQLQKEYEKKGVSVIGYAVDKGGLPVVKPWIVRNNIEFPVVLGNMDIAKKWGIKVLPTTLIINPQGKIIEQLEGIINDFYIITTFTKYLNENAPPPPISAKISPPSTDIKQHIYHLSLYDNEKIDNEKGIIIIIKANLTDQIVEQGIWLQLNLQSQNYNGQILCKPKLLYQRIDDPLKGEYVMFVRCDQLPYLPENSYLRIWVTILNNQKKIIDKSFENYFPRPCYSRTYH